MGEPLLSFKGFPWKKIILAHFVVIFVLLCIHGCWTKYEEVVKRQVLFDSRVQYLEDQLSKAPGKVDTQRKTEVINETR